MKRSASRSVIIFKKASLLGHYPLYIYIYIYIYIYNYFSQAPVATVNLHKKIHARTRHTIKTSFKWSIHARALQQIVNYPARARPLTLHKSTYALSAYFVQRKNHCHSIHSDLVCLVYRPIDPPSRATVVLHSPGLSIGS